VDGPRWTIVRLKGVDWPEAINERGEVAGSKTLAPGAIHERVVVWEKGRVRDLGTLGGWTSEFPYGPDGGRYYHPEPGVDVINDRGQVVGHTTTRGSQYPHNLFLWQNGQMRNLGVFTDTSGPEVVGINERGEVVGNAGQDVGFFWRNGKMWRNLGRAVAAINDRGQAVGVFPSKAERACWWNPSGMHKLVTLGRESRALAINNRSQIVGASYTKNTAELPHTFLWQNGRMLDLGEWFVTAINERGQMIGKRRIGFKGWRALTWLNGRLRALGTPPGDKWTQPVAINDRGQNHRCQLQHLREERRGCGWAAVRLDERPHVRAARRPQKWRRHGRRDQQPRTDHRPHRPTRHRALDAQKRLGDVPQQVVNR
jgi:probable HAF family extracellular repeat protein